MSAHPEQAQANRCRTLLYLAITATVLVHLATFSARPELFFDDVVTLSRVESILNSGEPNGEFDDPVQRERSGAGAVEIYNPRTPYYFFAIPSVFGFAPTIGTIRLMTLVAGFLIAVAIGSIASSTLGPSYGPFAALFSLISPGFVYSSHIARPDVLAAALGYIGIAAYLRRDRHPALAGFLTVLAFSAHQRSVILTIPLLVLLSTDLTRRKVPFRCAVHLVLGCIAAALLIAIVDIAPQYDRFIGTQMLVARAVPPPIAAAGQHVLLKTLGEFSGLVADLYPFAWPLLLLLFVGPLRSPASAAQPQFILVVSTLVMSLLCIHGMVPVKSVFFTPVVDLLFVSLLSSTFPLLRSNLATQTLKRAVVVLFIVSAAFQNGRYLKAPDCRERAPEFSSELRKYIPAGSTVMGSEHLWLFLHDSPYVSWKRLQLSRSISDRSLEELMQSYRPDYLLRDRDMRWYISDTPSENRFFESLRVPAAPFFDVLERHAQSLGTVTLGCYGSVDIFRFQWSDNARTSEQQTQPDRGAAE